MSNKDLLKQAIAEAKTIREAAIANAKEALEESLTPHLKDMLAAKLQEMEEADDIDEIVNEEDTINNPEGETAHGNVAEAEEEEEAEEAEGEEAEEEGEEEGEEAEEEELDLENMSVEEFKDLVRDIVAQEVGHDESEEEMPGEEAPEGEDLTGMDSEEEEIDINELLAELAEMDGDVEEGEEMVNEELVTLATGALLAAIGVPSMVASAIGITKLVDLAKAGKFGDKAKAAAEKLEKAGGVAGDTVQQRNESATTLNEEPMALATGALIAAIGVPSMVASAIGISKLMDLAKAGKFGDKAKAAAEKLEKAGGVAGDIAQQRGGGELEEALETVAELRTQLQEVNLLNAKLLYVNKVFKANNLTESQKVNVVAAFDKAETVKEVKLVFETVSKNVVAKPVAIKEHKSFASKPAGTTATAGKKEIISEVSEQVARWQKLAGIIK
jgi:hypothetical protein